MTTNDLMKQRTGSVDKSRLFGAAPVGGVLAVAALGAAAIYFLDPKQGAARRSSLKGKVQTLAGVRSDQRFISFEESVILEAPIGEVFGFFSNWDDFPSFMRNIREVRELGGGLSHWSARGPIGASVSWDARVTDMRVNEIISWESVQGELIENSGSIRFTEVAAARTNVCISFRYSPPMGVIGHKVATTLGADPQVEMREDLQRVKTYFATGRPAPDAAAKLDDKSPHGFSDKAMNVPHSEQSLPV